MKAKFNIGKIENLVIVRAIRNGLVNLIPILTIGAFALILQTFPITAYQTFIKSFLNGFVLKLLEIIYSGTFGVLSLHMTFSISISYMRLKASKTVSTAGANFTSIACFFILAGAYLNNFNISMLGPKSMFLAILTGLGASALFTKFSDYFETKNRTLLSSGADIEFNRMLTTFLPMLFVVSIFSFFNLMIIKVFDIDSFRSLLINFFNGIFEHISNGFFKGFVFVFLSSLLWFFGIHGSDVLEPVMEINFTPGLAANQAAIAAGSAPTTILTKGFFDCFVLMGGCGSAICLLIAILLFSKNKQRRSLGIAASFPMIFNINEMMVFGLPIIFNTTMLIPFLLVPLICYSLSYVAMSLGIVPLIISSVEWTTPIILGGYIATKSISGALLQIINVIIGVFIYLPFIKKLDIQTEEQIHNNYNVFLNYYKENESDLQHVQISTYRNIYGDMARELILEMKENLEKNLVLAYQPQYNYQGICIGAEALLRWKHPVYGYLYPPMVIKLAEEGGFLERMEEAILKLALKDRPKVLERFGPQCELSINVTGTTVVKQEYQEFFEKLNDVQPFKDLNISIEVTEQAAINFNDDTINALMNLKRIGVKLAIDDFSMGQTSIKYLEDNIFDIIKIDGSLVKGVVSNQNCREIISSIARLATRLNMMIISEYVGTKEEKEELHKIGCDNYQGYLYSPAVFLDDK